MMYKTLLLLLRMVQHIDVLSWHYRYKPVKCVEKVEGPNFIVDSPELMLSKPVGPVPAELPYSRITGQPNCRTCWKCEAPRTFVADSYYVD